MKALQRRNYSFDTRSVMLFAALSLGGAGASQAQTPSTLSPPQFGPASKSTAQSGSGLSVGPSSGGVSTAAAAAFDKADSNKDGSLSRAEFDAAQTRRVAGEHGRGPGRMPAPAPAPTK